MLPHAVIDVGTNSVKLLVGNVHEGQVTPLLERSVQTRLGQGFYKDHYLLPEPMAETVRTVSGFAEEARAQGAAAIRILATSAARDAKNAGDLMTAVRDACGLDLEVISGEQEADWAFRAVTSDPRLTGRPVLILDVGGGSTEFILGRDQDQEFRRSFQLGCVRLLEQLRIPENPGTQHRNHCLAAVREFLAKEASRALEPAMAGYFPESILLVGTGGTATVLGALELRLPRFDRDRLEGLELSIDTVRESFLKLWRMPLAARRQLPGLPPERADVMLTGSAIYLGVMELFGLNSLRVSTRGMRFAALLETALRSQPTRSANGLRSQKPRKRPAAGTGTARLAAFEAAARSEAQALMAHLEREPRHVEQVTRLALLIFDQLTPVHKLTHENRVLLVCASLLHDIGWKVAPDGAKHHKHSARMIREHPWQSLDPRQVTLVSLIARYHRKSPPSAEHRDFASLPPRDQVRVRKLASILRIADGLDRSHLQHVEDIQVVIESGRLAFRVTASSDLRPELAALAKKAGLARTVYKREPEFVIQRS